MDRCYGPGDKWKSDRGCSIFTCKMYQKSNGDVDMVVARDIGTMIIYNEENEPISIVNLIFIRLLVYKTSLHLQCLAFILLLNFCIILSFLYKLL